MTHYTMSYAGLTDEVKSARAIQDIKDYLGEDKFESTTEIMRREMIPYEQFTMAMAFMAGIEGYPVKAWYEHVYGPGTAVVVDAEAVTETGGN